MLFNGKSCNILPRTMAGGTAWIAMWFKLDGTKALIMVPGTW